MGEVVKFPPHASQSYVSPYLLRPLRRVEEVEAARRQAEPDDEAPPAKRTDPPARAGQSPRAK